MFDSLEIRLRRERFPLDLPHDGSGAWSAPLTPYKTNLSKTYSFVTAMAAG